MRFTTKRPGMYSSSSVTSSPSRLRRSPQSVHRSPGVRTVSSRARCSGRGRRFGWTPQLREKNLPLVVDNPRFLILPWIEIPNLGSHILALIRRRLPDDWTERYNTTPVLIKTFVETPRYTGHVYKASGWLRVGTTQGRGRYDQHTKRAQPKKDI